MSTTIERPFGERVAAYAKWWTPVINLLIALITLIHIILSL